MPCWKILLFLWLVVIGLPVNASPESSRLWFTWEHTVPNTSLCQQKNLCDPVKKYTTRLFEESNTARARAVINAIGELAVKRGHPVDHPEAPKACQNVNAMTVLGFDPESWEMSEKLAALRGLPGIHFSVRRLKAPLHYVGPFGDQLQELIERKFHKNGIQTLSKQQMQDTPGQPRLNIYFTNTNANTGCWFSVYASLSQTMLLTRNHTVKLRAGTWGMSGGYSTDHPNRSEFDAIIAVVDKLIVDYWKANSSDTVNASVKR